MLNVYATKIERYRCTETAECIKVLSISDVTWPQIVFNSLSVVKYGLRNMRVRSGRNYPYQHVKLELWVPQKEISPLNYLPWYFFWLRLSSFMHILRYYTKTVLSFVIIGSSEELRLEEIWKNGQTDGGTNGGITTDKQNQFQASLSLHKHPEAWNTTKKQLLVYQPVFFLQHGTHVYTQQSHTVSCWMLHVLSSHATSSFLSCWTAAYIYQTEIKSVHYVICVSSSSCPYTTSYTRLLHISTVSQ